MTKSRAVSRILIMMADPSDQARLRLTDELDRIQQSLKSAEGRGAFALEYNFAARRDRLQTSLLDVRPAVVHFIGHGSGPGGLVLEDTDGHADLVSTAALAEMFSGFDGVVQCVVLNCCLGAVQAAEIVRYVPYVVGMTHEIGDAAARDFAAGFFGALFRNEGYDAAFTFGCNSIHLNETPTNGAAAPGRPFTANGNGTAALPIPEHLKPILYFRPDIFIRCHPEDDSRVNPKLAAVLRTAGIRVGCDSQFRKGRPAPFDRESSVRNSRHIFVIWTQNWQAATAMNDAETAVNYGDPRAWVLWIDGPPPGATVPASRVIDLTDAALQTERLIGLLRDRGFSEEVIDGVNAQKAGHGLMLFQSILGSAAVRIESPAVQASISVVVSNLAKARDNIGELNRWKLLHDHLHQILILFAPLVDLVDTLRRAVSAPEDDSAPDRRQKATADAWRRVQAFLRKPVLPALRVLLEYTTPPCFQPSEIPWVSILKLANEKLEAGRDKDQKALRRGIELLEPVIDMAMTKVDYTLFSTAAQVPLGTLVKKLEEIVKPVRQATLASPAADQFQEFERGIGALKQLDERLRGLITIHNCLQTIDGLTKHLEDPDVAAEAIDSAWQGMRDTVALLEQIAGEDWLGDLCRLVNEVRELLPAALSDSEPDSPSLSRLRDAFSEFRSQLDTGFLQADLTLKRFCTTLMGIRDSLDEAIKGLQP